MIPKARSSEVDAYVFIKDELKQLGWDTRSPARHPSGRVYTQSECLAHPDIKAALGLEKPENVVKVSESVVWVVEAKRAHTQLAQALAEAQGYALKINATKNLQALFITGVVGNDVDGFLVETRYFINGSYQAITINGKAITSFLSPQVAATVLQHGPAIKDVSIDEALFLAKAEKINQYLHLGAINKNYRARVIAALLLALVEDTSPNIDAPPSVLIQDINARAQRVLRIQGKPEFFKYIEIALPPTEDNHIKFKGALVQTLQELNNLNIRSAMKSGTDVLGKFYEVFLKYGNGAKEIGIVLTPRHVTRFAVEAIGVSDRDIVYDPTCGTAGFLVAAFDHVRRNYSEAAIDRFKQFNIFGVDQEAEVVALALVNMIFRGDGKNNIIEGNTFQKNLQRTSMGRAEWISGHAAPTETVVTRALMNPPFALKTSDEKEYRFVDHALLQMEDGGLLFSVLPYSAMVRGGEYLNWRRNGLLRRHTLMCVVTFPEDLFYPVGVHTLGIVVKKGIPHPQSHPVLWLRALTDGLLKRKGVRLPNVRAGNDLAVAEGVLRQYLVSPLSPIANKDSLQKASAIDLQDTLLELVPEKYLDQSAPSAQDIQDAVEQVIRDTVAFMVSSGIPGVIDDGHWPPASSREPSFISKRIDELFNVHSGDFHAASELDIGRVPLISCGDSENGLVGYYAVPEDSTFERAITVAYNGRPLTAKFHPYKFGAKDDVAVLTPLEPMSDASLLYIAAALNWARWRYSYGRKCFREKLCNFSISIPIHPDTHQIDDEVITSIVRSDRVDVLMNLLWNNQAINRLPAPTSI